jgi:hypothetical protein
MITFPFQTERLIIATYTECKKLPRQDTDDENDASMSGQAALIRQMEQQWWELILPDVPNYAGLGGYWDWGTDRKLDRVFKEIWK